MRILKKIFLPLLLLVALTGCMHNNGDIGDFFGTWKVESISVNNSEDASYSGNIFFQFQTSVVRIVESKSHGDMTEFFGAWSDEGKTLILDLTYSVDPISDVYDIPTVTRLQRGVNTISLSDVSSRKMTWTFSSEEGDAVTFKLRKQ